MKLEVPLAEAETTAVVTVISWAVKVVQVAAVSVHRDFPQWKGVADGQAFQQMSLSPVYPEMQ